MQTVDQKGGIIRIEKKNGCLSIKQGSTLIVINGQNIDLFLEAVRKESNG